MSKFARKVRRNAHRSEIGTARATHPTHVHSAPKFRQGHPYGYCGTCGVVLKAFATPAGYTDPEPVAEPQPAPTIPEVSVEEPDSLAAELPHLAAISANQPEQV